MAAWKISSWLVSIRLFQLIGALVSASMNAFLIMHIYTNKLGLVEPMIIAELMIAALFIYTSLTLLVSHVGKRGKRTAWLGCMIISDVVFCCLDIAAITLLANSGLPDNCGGLTKVPTTADNGKTISPKPGFTTIGFSDGADGQRGELDKYCGLERSFYFVAVVIIYMVTLAVSVLRLCEGKIYSQGEVDEMLEERERMIELQQKVNDSRLALSPQNSNCAPIMENHVSQVVLSARPSIPAGPPPPPIAERRDYADSGPSRRLSFASSSPTAVNPASPVLSFMSLEHHANMAMVTDGSRYNNHIGIQLPPYSPGNNMSAMNGHSSNENNDIRLSDYVKGETRAQDMKDAGRF